MTLIANHVFSEVVCGWVAAAAGIDVPGVDAAVPLPAAGIDVPVVDAAALPVGVGVGVGVGGCAAPRSGIEAEPPVGIDAEPVAGIEAEPLGPSLPAGCAWAIAAAQTTATATS